MSEKAFRTELKRLRDSIHLNTLTDEQVAGPNDNKVGTGKLQSIADSVIGTSRKVAQDLGVGLANKTSGLNESVDQSNKLSLQLLERAKQVTDPEERKRLLKLAGEST